MTKELSGWEKRTAELAILNLGMQVFSREIITYGSTGAPFALEVLEVIRDRAINAVKNSDISGIKIEDESDILREGIKNLENLLNTTIAEGWKS